MPGCNLLKKTIQSEKWKACCCQVKVHVHVGFLLCLIRCFLSDEESLELAWLWNHRKFRVKNTLRVATATLKHIFKTFAGHLSVHSVLDSTMT